MPSVVEPGHYHSVSSNGQVQASIYLSNVELGLTLTLMLKVLLEFTSVNFMGAVLVTIDACALHRSNSSRNVRIDTPYI